MGPGERIKKCEEKKKQERNPVAKGGAGRESGGVDGIGKMRGKREGETDILEKGQATQARFC